MNNTMDLNHIKKHWQTWASEHGTSVHATTRGATAKFLEIDALSRVMQQIESTLGPRMNVLEAGCGNGLNCLQLAEKHPHANFLGIDYIEDMIQSANQLKTERKLTDDRVRFEVGNVLELSLPTAFFDVVFTDRCLINLNTDVLQQQAIASLVTLLKPNGYFLMIENSQQTHGMQNKARESVGLPARAPASFNHFFDETTLLPFLSSIGLELIGIEDFISFHDLVLYVLLPMINGGKIDYDHPLVDAATRLNLSLSSIQPSGFGQWGQNRLYKYRKRLA